MFHLNQRLLTHKLLANRAPKRPEFTLEQYIAKLSDFCVETTKFKALFTECKALQSALGTPPSSKDYLNLTTRQAQLFISFVNSLPKRDELWEPETLDMLKELADAIPEFLQPALEAFRPLLQEAPCYCITLQKWVKDNMLRPMAQLKFMELALSDGIEIHFIVQDKKVVDYRKGRTESDMTPKLPELLPEQSVKWSQDGRLTRGRFACQPDRDPLIFMNRKTTGFKSVQDANSGSFSTAKPGSNASTSMHLKSAGFKKTSSDENADFLFSVDAAKPVMDSHGDIKFDNTNAVLNKMFYLKREQLAARTFKAAGKAHLPSSLTHEDLGFKVYFSDGTLKLVNVQDRGGETVSSMHEDPDTRQSVYTPMRKEDLYLYTHDIATAVQFFHERGLVYGDIKPPNSLHTLPHQDRGFKLIDYNICPKQGYVHGYAGSPPYLPVETGNFPSRDSYSFAVTLMELSNPQLYDTEWAKIPRNWPTELAKGFPKDACHNGILGFYEKWAQSTQVDDQLKVLIGQCLAIDPKSRPPISDFLALTVVQQADQSRTQGTERVAQLLSKAQSSWVAIEFADFSPPTIEEVKTALGDICNYLNVAPKDTDWIQNMITGYKTFLKVHRESEDSKDCSTLEAEIQLKIEVLTERLKLLGVAVDESPLDTLSERFSSSANTTPATTLAILKSKVFDGIYAPGAGHALKEGAVVPEVFSNRQFFFASLNSYGIDQTALTTLAERTDINVEEKVKRVVNAYHAISHFMRLQDRRLAAEDFDFSQSWLIQLTPPNPQHTHQITFDADTFSWKIVITNEKGIKTSYESDNVHMVTDPDSAVCFSDVRCTEGNPETHIIASNVTHSQESLDSGYNRTIRQLIMSPFHEEVVFQEAKEEVPDQFGFGTDRTTRSFGSDSWFVEEDEASMTAGIENELMTLPDQACSEVAFGLLDKQFPTPSTQQSVVEYAGDKLQLLLIVVNQARAGTITLTDEIITELHAHLPPFMAGFVNTLPIPKSDFDDWIDIATHRLYELRFLSALMNEGVPIQLGNYTPGSTEWDGLPAPQTPALPRPTQQEYDDWRKAGHFSQLELIGEDTLPLIWADGKATGYPEGVLGKGGSRTAVSAGYTEDDQEEVLLVTSKKSLLLSTSKRITLTGDSNQFKVQIPQKEVQRVQGLLQAENLIPDATQKESCPTIMRQTPGQIFYINQAGELTMVQRAERLHSTVKVDEKRSEPVLTPEQMGCFINDIAHALQYCAKHRLAFNDLKPPNIGQTQGALPYYKLIDLGSGSQQSNLEVTPSTDYTTLTSVQTPHGDMISFCIVLMQLIAPKAFNDHWVHSTQGDKLVRTRSTPSWELAPVKAFFDAHIKGLAKVYPGYKKLISMIGKKLSKSERKLNKQPNFKKFLKLSFVTQAVKARSAQEAVSVEARIKELRADCQERIDQLKDKTKGIAAALSINEELIHLFSELVTLEPTNIRYLTNLEFAYTQLAIYSPEDENYESLMIEICRKAFVLQSRIHTAQTKEGALDEQAFNKKKRASISKQKARLKASLEQRTT